ncbi:MAG TPA: BTAD domain-containing putative transcriptional regulator [Candidatus Limnocylindrales bacterium]|nr:BTAD domain-containing putative transcriptional regulator [Candidatus Limnocylindrales bacterium]
MADGDAVAVVSAKVCVPQAPSLGRERLDALLSGLSNYRVGLVVAPAGSGKTTLLARFAATAAVPVAWYRAESWDGNARTMLSHLERACASALGDLPRGWQTVEDAARALEAWAGARAALVIDDVHTLEDSPAEATLERLIDYAPPSIVFLFGSRTPPHINLSRLRLRGALLEIGYEDLRFRSWEVERLYRDFYGEARPPEELAELARRTEGWAAGLQLFHLATHGKTVQERRRILSGLSARSRLTHEYLTRNVLAELPDDLRRFLVGTCVLGRVSGPLCDAFLGRTGSHLVLQELERRQMFTYALDERGWYRYHEVLRSHLEQLLREELGEAQAAGAYRRAGRLLEEHAALPEAVQAYCRAEDWQAVDRILRSQGSEVLDGAGTWIDALPPAILRQDPWLMLAGARRHRAEGRWEAAIDAYQRAERIFGATEAGMLCRSERIGLAAWLEPVLTPGTDWTALLRRAVAHDPLQARQAAMHLPEATGGLVSGIGLLLAGDPLAAREALAGAGEAADAGPPLNAAALLFGGVAALMSGDPSGILDVDHAAERAEALGLGWFARLARAARVLSRRPTTMDEATAIRQACDRDGDRWGSALVALWQGWAAVYADEPGTAFLEPAVDGFRRLGAGVLEAWARALLALGLARAGHPEAKETALQAENLARYSGASGARYFPYLALAIAEPDRAAEYLMLAEAVMEESHLERCEPAETREGNVIPMMPPARTAPSCSIRCFGGFRITVKGRPVDLNAIKPRPRALLRLLALHAGDPVHREVLQEALWPEADTETGARNLHVAISVLRQILEPGVIRGGSSLLPREGDAYRLTLAPDAEVDLVQFSRAISAGRMARIRGERVEAIAFLRQALDLYAGELLPEDGPADWVLEPRERYHRAVLETAQTLAELLLLGQEWSEAAQVCATGLWVDRYHDPLWRLLIDAHERAGDPGAARRARQDYARVLGELGLPQAEAAVSPSFGTRSR